jgi:hypothetical protein
VDRVLAVVGPRVITLSDARAAVTFGLVEPPPGADAVAEGVAYLVNRQLMLSEVDRYGVPPPAPTRFPPRKRPLPRPRNWSARGSDGDDRTGCATCRDTLRIESYPIASTPRRSRRSTRSSATSRPPLNSPVGAAAFEEVREQVQVRVTTGDGPHRGLAGSPAGTVITLR